ncbi:unnamed protein product [Dracunculus medinensis]|uniref:Probable arginine--tRNA ligase, cytoplasmic n=1 Tax=Dracunculus medinensis TaxID=318479 RepID=A0A0N4U1S2_DRAME|nr:unnamed protein product [Dracunculus medinensis]
MDHSLLTEELLEYCPELKEISTDISKLEYRVQFLRKVIAEQEKMNSLKTEVVSGIYPHSDSKIGRITNDKTVMNSNSLGQAKVHKYVKVENYGCSIKTILEALFSVAIRNTFPKIADFPVEISETALPKFGDYQFNSAMVIFKRLKQMGEKTDPQTVSRLIMNNVEDHEAIKRVETAGNYINIILNIEWIGKKICEMALEGIPVPRVMKQKVVVDFSSPNIAKEMHVGHLRSTIIGDGICRLFEYFGFEVVRINHIGDWGTQFGMLIAHLQDCFPNYLSETPSISDLQTFYKESKKRFDKDENFKARAYQCVVKLQNFDGDSVKAWQMICDVSRKDFNRIYDRLDIKIIERGESFYQDLMKKTVRELEERGVLEDDEGRKVMFVDGSEIPLTIVKSDGGFTYDTSDLATIKHRLEVEEADWLIYVVDAGQSLHLENIYAAARQLGWYKPEEKRVLHVAFGLVLGDDRKKFKTRSGESVKLTDLLDEGIRRSEMKLLEKERDKVMTVEEMNSARDAIAYGCIKYADLSQTRTKDYIFSFDKMLDDKGNTAVYLLYAYTRIRSICRTSGVSPDQIKEYIKQLPSGLPFQHEAEIKLAKTILKFSDCILAVLDSLMLHQICDFAYRLATTFHDFYNECYVIHKESDGKEVINYHRLVLCQVTADTMADCFKILGIRTVEKM